MEAEDPFYSTWSDQKKSEGVFVDFTDQSKFLPYNVSELDVNIVIKRNVQQF